MMPLIAAAHPFVTTDRQMVQWVISNILSKFMARQVIYALKQAVLLKELRKAGDQHFIALPNNDKINYHLPFKELEKRKEK